MANMLYHDKTKVAGTDSAATHYLAEIPVGFHLDVKHFAATIYTTTIGVYGTQKYIMMGYELEGTKYILYGGRVNAGYGRNPLVVWCKNFYIPENAKPFVIFEATSTSETYEVMINGTLEKIPAKK